MGFTGISELRGSFRQLVNDIEKNPPATSEELIHILRQINFTKEDLEPYQQFTHDPLLSYGRAKIYEGINFNIYLMSWTPGDFTAIHSHGSTDWGAVCFFSDIDHRLYQVEGMKIFLLDKSMVPAGTIVPVTGSLVHAMGNLSKTPKVSLHIYGSGKEISNANDRSQVYEIEKKQIRTTHGEAYININEETCLDTVHGLTADSETLVDYLSIILNFYRKNKLDDMIGYLESIIRQPELFFLP